MAGGEFGDHNVLLRSNSSASEDDLEAQPTPSSGKKGIRDLLKRLDRRFNSSRRFSGFNRRSLDGAHHHNSVPSPSYSDHGVNYGYSNSTTNVNGNLSAHAHVGEADMVGDFAPPEWALLLIGCLLGLATGLCVAAFNRGVGLKILSLCDFAFCFLLISS